MVVVFINFSLSKHDVSDNFGNILMLIDADNNDTDDIHDKEGKADTKSHMVEG